MCGAFLCGLLHHSSSEDAGNAYVYVNLSQYRPRPWTIERAITDLGSKLACTKAEALKIGDFDLLIRKAMYDIRIRVNLDQLEERDPMQAFNIDHALYEARKTIMNSFIDFKTRGAGGASDFQHAVEMAVNSVLDQASNDNDDDGDDLFDRKMMYGFL